MRYSVAASIFSHVLIAILLFFVHQSNPNKPKVIEIEYLNPPPQKATNGAAGKSKSKGRHYNLPGSALTPKLPIPGPTDTALNPERDSLAGGTSEWPAAQWGNGGGNFGEIVHFLVYERLQEEIRGLLNYPYILARKGLHGTVNVRLAFTDDSQCDWKKIKITSHERHFRVYILALLKKLCTFSVVKNLNADRRRKIDISFNFDLVNEFTPVQLRYNHDFIVGNVLSFRRTVPKSVAEYQIGPIRGLWFVPAVALDFPWLVEKWDQYVNGIDPMAAFRE